MPHRLRVVFSKNGDELVFELLDLGIGPTPSFYRPSTIRLGPGPGRRRGRHRDLYETHAAPRSALRRSMRSSISRSCQRLTPPGLNLTGLGNLPARTKRHRWGREYGMPLSRKSA